MGSSTGSFDLDASAAARLLMLFRTVLTASLRGTDDSSVEEVLSEIEGMLGGCQDDPSVLDALHGLRASAIGSQLDAANRRRRESELRALLEIAQQLMSSHDFGKLLEEIVRSTQRLIGSDVAHLNLLANEDLVGTLRVTSGALTEGFPNQRTPPTRGITGMVMRRKSAYVSSEYLTDPEVDHDSSGDAALRAEWLVTLAGFPLLHNQEVIGVLIAGWRTRTDLETDQLVLLGSLASLATLAIVGVRLTQENTRALEQLEQAHDQIQSANAELEWSSSAHDRITEMLLTLPDMDELAVTLSDLLDSAIAIVSHDGESLAWAPFDGGEVRGLTEHLDLPLEILTEVRTTGRLTSYESSDRGRVWVSPAIAGKDLMGAVLIHREEMTSSERRTAERMGMATALMLLMQRSVQEAEAKFVTDLVDDLTRGVRLEHAVRRACTMGVELNRPSVVLVMSPSIAADKHASDLARCYARDRNGLAGEAADSFVAIVPGDDPDAHAECLSARLLAIGRATAIGASGPIQRSDEIATAFQQARRWLNTFLRLERSGAATYRSLGFVGVLLGGDSHTSISEFVTRNIGPLLCQDSERGTDLVRTLECYLSHRSSLKAAAKELHVHPNTVLQRLQRVAQLLEIDIRDSRQLLEIQLALHLEPLSK